MTPGSETSRLDSALAARGLARSRTHAAALIADGLVSVDGRPVVKASAPVADDALHPGVQLRIRPPAVEEGELVAPGERRVRECAAEESRPAQDEELHARSASAERSRSTSSSVCTTVPMW